MCSIRHLSMIGEIRSGANWDRAWRRLRLGLKTTKVFIDTSTILPSQRSGVIRPYTLSWSNSVAGRLSTAMEHPRSNGHSRMRPGQYPRPVTSMDMGDNGFH